MSTEDAAAAPDSTTPCKEIKDLATVVNGCRDDGDGIAAKLRLVQSFALKDNLFNAIAWLHILASITIDTTELLR